MSRFEATPDEVRARMVHAPSLYEAVHSRSEARAAVIHDKLVAGIETFRNGGDRNLLADILLTIVNGRHRP